MRKYQMNGEHTQEWTTPQTHRQKKRGKYTTHRQNTNEKKMTAIQPQKTKKQTQTKPESMYSKLCNNPSAQKLLQSPSTQVNNP